jgi:maltooligosyltrehalose trehalohydrolase
MQEFKVWAPLAKRMQLSLGEQTLPMTGPDGRGCWHVQVAEAGCGQDYAFLIDDDATPYPDPRSPWQPQGVHGMSRLYDQSKFAWTDQRWIAPLERSVRKGRSMGPSAIWTISSSLE